MCFGGPYAQWGILCNYRRIWGLNTKSHFFPKCCWFYRVGISNLMLAAQDSKMKLLAKYMFGSLVWVLPIDIWKKFQLSTFSFGWQPGRFFPLCAPKLVQMWKKHLTVMLFMGKNWQKKLACFKPEQTLNYGPSICQNNFTKSTLNLNFELQSNSVLLYSIWSQSMEMFL